MPDPTAHADDMKSLAVIKPDEMPAFWWINPWAYALGLKRALDAVHLLSETTEDAYQAAKTVIKQKEEMVDRQNKSIIDTANEAGFQASKVGYVINGQPCSPFPLTWLGEAVAYWKSEAYAARKQRDEAKELADYHRNNLNTFQRKVELTLKPVFNNCGYEDTIDLVNWAAEEIKDRRAEKVRNDADLLEAKELVMKLLDEREKYENDLTKAEARVKQLTVFCQNAGAERDREKQRVEDRDRQINTRDEAITELYKHVRSLKRKLSKAQKVAGIKPAKKKGAPRA